MNNPVKLSFVVVFGLICGGMIGTIIGSAYHGMAHEILDQIDGPIDKLSHYKIKFEHHNKINIDRHHWIKNVQHRRINID